MDRLAFDLGKRVQGSAEEFQLLADEMDSMLRDAHELEVAQSQCRADRERLQQARVPISHSSAETHWSDQLF